MGADTELLETRIIEGDDAAFPSLLSRCTDRLSRMMSRDGIGHRAARGLHQVDARDAGRRRSGVSTGHLGATCLRSATGA